MPAPTEYARAVREARATLDHTLLLPRAGISDVAGKEKGRGHGADAAVGAERAGALRAPRLARMASAPASPFMPRGLARQHSLPNIERT